MTNNHYNIDKKLREMENQLAPDLTLLENHWQHIKSILVAPSLPKSPGRGFLNNPFRLFTLLCAAGLACIIIYEYASTSNIQSGGNNGSPSTNPMVLKQTDTVPESKKKVAAYKRKDSSTHSVPKKKIATQKKMYPANKHTDSIGLVSSPTPENYHNDTIHFYSANKKVASYAPKKPTASQKVLYARPVKKKNPTTDTLRLNLDSVTTNTNVNHNKRTTKKMNKSNNTSIDSTKYR